MDHQNSDLEDSNRIYWDCRAQADGVAGKVSPATPTRSALLRYAGGVGVEGALPFTQAVCAACSSSSDDGSDDDSDGVSIIFKEKY